MPKNRHAELCRNCIIFHNFHQIPPSPTLDDWLMVDEVTFLRPVNCVFCPSPLLVGMDFLRPLNLVAGPQPGPDTGALLEMSRYGNIPCQPNQTLCSAGQSLLLCFDVLQQHRLHNIGLGLLSPGIWEIGKGRGMGV